MHFLGKLDSVAPLLASADLFLLPSDRESFGLSALEALASGVPVVGCAVGGLPEVVRDGETGVWGTASASEEHRHRRDEATEGPTRDDLVYTHRR